MHNMIRVSSTMPKLGEWHLKVKVIEHNAGLTKNYCITVSMQKISSICKLILMIQHSYNNICPCPP